MPVSTSELAKAKTDPGLQEKRTLQLRRDRGARWRRAHGLQDVPGLFGSEVKAAEQVLKPFANSSDLTL